MSKPKGIIALSMAVVTVAVLLSSVTVSAAPPLSGAIFTTLEDGTRVNANIYSDKRDVYLDGGPGPNAPRSAAGLPDGNYYFQVTDPSGKTLLSSDPVKCREFRVEGGIIVEYVSIGRTYVSKGQTKPCYVDGKQYGKHDTGFDDDWGALTIQLMPYDDTPNKGGVYKAWATPIGDFQGDPENVDNPCGTGCFHGFLPSASKTDNFKAKAKGQFVAPIIFVKKFEDLDGDGVWDAGEPEIGVDEFVDGGGWPVSVTDPTDTVANGFTPYTYFPGFAGTFVVEEELLTGWTQTAAYLDGAPVSPLSPAVNVPVAHTSGETHTVVFGNFQCFSVTGSKVNDLDGDGVQDAGEPTIPGWTIELYRDGVLVATTTTDSEGVYRFEVCQGGRYEVVEVIPAGWTNVSPASFSFTGTSGTDQGPFDFLNFQCFAVSGYKVEDTNGNGVWDAGESGLAGWTIELYQSGALVDSTTTDATGFYSFSVCEGGSYEVREVQQDGWTATGPTSFSFDAVSGQSQQFDFLNFELGQVCGLKWYDFDKDGVQDGTEPTIAGWQIQLYKNGALFATAFTDGTGAYCFTDLGPGSYEVVEVMPANPDADHVWAQTFPASGSYVIPGTSGFSVTDADFGNVCEFTQGLTMGYWKTHTGSQSPPRDETYDLLPANPLDVDVTTPDGDDLVEYDYEADYIFDGAGGGEVNCEGTPGVEKCRSLFRAQLLALHMNLLKFGGMADQTYINAGDPYSGQTVQQIYDAAVALLNDGAQHDFTSFQETLDAINNNGHEGVGDHVLVSDEPCPVNYP